jgi:hypothetical protein
VRVAAAARVVLSVCAASACLGSCTPAATRPAASAAVRTAAGPLPPGPEPPARASLPVPSLDVAWLPPIVRAGDLDALAAALGDRAKVHVRRGERTTASSEQVAALVRSLRKDSTLAKSDRGGVGSIVAGALPLRREVAKSSEEPPRYVAEPLALQPTWRADVDADALVVLDDAPIDEAAWRGLPTHARGSCSAPLMALAVGQEQSLAQLEPFLDHADAVLWQLWRAELRTELPAIVAPVEARKDAARDDRSLRECALEARKLVEPYQRCAEDATPCPLAPRLFLIGGARIGAPEPDTLLTRRCASALGVDVVARVRALGREAAEAAATHLDPGWVALADRLGGITEVYAALEDVCTPRRRRFAAVDAKDARDRLVRIGEQLRADEPPGAAARWRFDIDVFHVPGTGPVRQSARFDAGPGAPARQVLAEAKALRQFVLTRALCRSGWKPLPLAVLVLDPRARSDADAVRFFGYFYEEELVCGDLVPAEEDAAAVP